MRIKLFTIYDAKAEAYMPLFSMAASGLAIRTFADMANDRNHAVGQHPEDYTLFEIGNYDDQDALVTMLDAKIPLGNALEYKEDSPQQELLPTNQLKRVKG